MKTACVVSLCALVALSVCSVPGCVTVEKEQKRRSAPIPTPGPSADNAEQVGDAETTDGPDRIADDGRPEWWFPEVRREGDALRLCVETIVQGSLRDASRRAVEVASERAAIETRRAGYEFREDAMMIERSWGWPLPSLPGREPGYAGYAMVQIDLSGLSLAG